MRPVILIVFCTISLSACSSIDSTQELDQQQTRKLARQVYHVKPIQNTLHNDQ